MNLQLRQTAAAKRLPTRSRADDLARGGILAAGVACLLLLAWGHLGLGALLFPPAPTVAQQTVVTGPYRVTLRLESGQPTARGPNTMVLSLQDQAGHPITDASLRVSPVMTTMPMNVPDLEGQAQGGGQYIIHPVFGMAGDWRLAVAIAAPGRPAMQVSFSVGVRWS